MDFHTLRPSDVSHIAHSRVTRHSENDRRMIAEWRVTHCTIKCDTSLRKWARNASRMTWHTGFECRVTRCTIACDTSLRKCTKGTLSSDVPHIAQSCVTRHSENARNRFLEWRGTHDCALCDTSLWRSVLYQCVTRHSTKCFRHVSLISWVTCHTGFAWRVTHCTIVCGTSLWECTKHLLSSDVSDVAQSCMTRHAGAVWSIFLEWRVTQDCAMWITLEVSVLSMCDTSLEKAFSCLSWVTWHTCLCKVDAPHSPHHLTIHFQLLTFIVHIGHSPPPFGGTSGTMVGRFTWRETHRLIVCIWWGVSPVWSLKWAPYRFIRKNERNIFK